jgi:diacylglycerol kinase
MPNEYSLNGRIHSFSYAFSGIWTMLKTQPNARIHAASTILVILAGFIFNLSTGEWCWTTMAIVAVWMAESLNTAIEFLCDAASPEFHPLIKRSKDVSAGAVLIAALGAVTIGILVFGPKVLAQFQ